MTEKPFYTSKTFWVNLIILVLSFTIDYKADFLALGISEEWATRLVLIANLGLRFITTAKLTLSVRG